MRDELGFQHIAIRPGQFGGPDVGPVSEKRFGGTHGRACGKPLKIVLPPPTIKAEDNACGVVNDLCVMERNVRPFLSQRHYWY